MQNIFSTSFPLFKTILPIGLIFPLLFAGQADAQIDLTGFIRNYNALKHTPENELLIGRNRLRLDLSRDLSHGEIVISNDIQNLYSSRTDSVIYRLREAYIDLYGSNSDWRIGRQMLVWGRAEGTFVTDILTPVDLSEFLTQNFADLRSGVTAVSWTRYFETDFLQLVWNPVFRPNRLPEPGSRWFPSPTLDTNLAVRYSESTSEPKLKDMQLAARFAFRSSLKYDLDIGLLYWHYPSPVYRKSIQANIENGFFLNLAEQYTQSVIGMYSGTLQLTDKLLFTSESAFYSRRSFDYLSDALRSQNLLNPTLPEQLQIAQIFAANQDGFVKERPWLISMVGLQYELWDVTMNGQFINEHIFDHDPTILQEEDFYYATLSLRRTFLRDKVNVSAFGRYNFEGDDFWIHSELSYTGIDSFELAVGTQLFGGNETPPLYGHFSFEEFKANSFSYIMVAAYF